MDTITYETLITSTLEVFRNSAKNLGCITNTRQLVVLFDDCEACISQTIDMISFSLSNGADNLPNKLGHFLQNAVTLVQHLSDFIKMIIESVPTTCSSMKLFPVATGNILLVVFTHCKDSEAIYGIHLNNVKKQLQDLFRACHELQLTYLTIMEKSLVFDFTEKEQEDIFIEALNINLKIGEVVQTLDVKTLAEQWKAYTMICDLHILVEKQVYNNSTKVLCAMIEKNIQMSVEVEQDEKIVLRSLKVTNFTIKILSKILNIFKGATYKHYDHIVQLLVTIYLYNEAYLRMEKVPQLIQSMTIHVYKPSGVLLNDLFTDDLFLDCITKCNNNHLYTEEKTLGHLNVIMAVIKIILENNSETRNFKHKIVDYIFGTFTEYRQWFDSDLYFSGSDGKTCGLYEELLMHVFALTSIMNCEEMTLFEQRMFEILMGTDSYLALFVSNIWVLLSRISSRQYTLNQLISLCTIYQKLETRKMFATSPQETHFRYTINSLFEYLPFEDKMKVYNQFDIQNEKNISIWTVLKLKNLPEDIQNESKHLFAQKFKSSMNVLLTSGFTKGHDIDNLVNLMKVLADCSFDYIDEQLENLVVKAWTTTCQMDKQLHAGNLWFFHYVKSLAELTQSMMHLFQNSNIKLAKVLHIISNIINSGSVEFKFTLIELVCKLTTVNNEDNHLVNSLSKNIFKALCEEPDYNVRNKLFSVLSGNTELSDMIFNNFSDNCLRELWESYKKYGTVEDMDKENIDDRFTHKCLPAPPTETRSGLKSLTAPPIETNSLRSIKSTDKSSGNFDFVDLDNLFDESDTEQPLSKKAKIDSGEVDEIVSRLESDSLLLCKVKENFSTEYIKRIRKVCNRLENVLN